MPLIEMKIEGIGLDPSNNPVVLLHAIGRDLYVPFWMSPSEAVAIQVVLEAQPQPRPQTHDLMLNSFEECGIQLERVTIDAVEEDIYYASLHLLNGDITHIVDARPSDAIALALRANVPILADDILIDSIALEAEPPTSA